MSGLVFPGFAGEMLREVHWELSQLLNEGVKSLKSLAFSQVFARCLSVVGVIIATDFEQ